MYKFFTYMSVFLPLYTALLCMNQYLTGKDSPSILAMLIFMGASFVLATRLANIIDKADQKKP